MIGLPSSSYCTSSYSACATPCAMPPCCWPATSSGLTMRAAVVDRDVAQRARPARSRCRPRRPRCASRTGTTNRPALKSSSCASAAPCLRPAGVAGSFTAAASSAHDSGSRGRRRPRGRRRRRTMSSGFASSRCAASCFAWASTSSLATEQRAAADLQRARPAGAAAPRDTRGVGLDDADLSRSGRRACSLTIIENVVSWPWPCALVPTRAVTRAVVVDLDRAVLLVNADRRGDLDVRRRRRCRAASVSPRSRRGLLLGAQLVVAGDCEPRRRAPSRTRRCRRSRAGDRRERERVGRDEVRACGSRPDRCRARRRRCRGCARRGAIASGRPAPRYAAIGVVLVTAACQLNSTFGIAYTFCDIICVKNGRNAPIAGYAPASATVRTRRPVIVPSRFRPSST